MSFRTMGDVQQSQYLYLDCKQHHSRDAHPAVDGVQVRHVDESVEVEHGTQAQDGEHQSQEHQPGVHQLPDTLLLTPGEREPIHNSRCRHTKDMDSTSYP